MVAFSLLAESPTLNVSENQALEMQILQDLKFQEMVKVYDYEGNLLKEMTLNQVANNEITAADFSLLDVSDYAFSFCGDYYYFQNEKYATVVN